ncbi:VTT domain-containing protein [Weissella uvarum]|nr:VTT domain-containing protein [Weissella uvarum]
METILDIFIHLDKHLDHWVNILGPWSYGLIFAVIFIETGSVIFPFLPGDSLLFAAGAVAALPKNVLNPIFLIVIVWIAVFLGDSLNFYIGRTVGLPLVHSRIFGRFISQKNLDDTNNFFQKHGALAIILARFMPIIRTLSPFTAALSGYPYKRFIMLDMIAAGLWTLICIPAGYYFGSIPFIQKNFSLVIFGILFVSALPAIIGGIKSYLSNKKENANVE